jgi:hypothetical protein
MARLLATGGSLTDVTVTIVASSSHKPPGSVALNVIVSCPNQLAGAVKVTT